MENELRELHELHELASVFRAALESAKGSRLPITLQDFPHGACGDAALLLAKFLEHHGHGPFDYMFGRRGDGNASGWLGSRRADMDRFSRLRACRI